MSLDYDRMLVDTRSDFDPEIADSWEDYSRWCDEQDRLYEESMSDVPVDMPMDAWQAEPPIDPDEIPF